MNWREAIRHERRVELGMEFDRFYDLVRWGIAKEVLHAAGKTGYQDRHALLPSRKTKLTSRMVYWFKIPIINL